MPKPDNITNDMIEKWTETLKEDEMIISILEIPGAKETLLAGIWFSEQLNKRNCPQNCILQLQYTGGKLSYGHNDPWEVHQKLLDAYDNNQLVFETDPATTLH